MCDTEATRDEALKKLLTVAEYSDVVLKGKDGVHVPALRSLLSARSEVFQKMFYGNFTESKKDMVELPYSGCVLKSLVEYIYMDTVKTISEDGKEDTDAVKREQECFGETIIGLIEAGTYYALPNLVSKAKESAVPVMKRKPNIAYICLSKCESPISQSFVLEFIRNHRVAVLRDNCGFVESIDETKLALILKDKDLYLNELHRFKLLQAWAQSGFDAERVLQAKQLASHLHLQHINPTDLSTIVAPSSLVSERRMLEAFRAHALLAEQRFGMCYEPTRNPRWTATNGQTNHRLKCLPLCSGKHSWQVRVYQNRFRSGALRVGVASSTRGEDSTTHVQSVGENTAFMYGSDGSVMSKGLVSPSAHPIFRGRITITLSLDLMGSGTLSASLDNGKTSFELFNNMRDVCQDSGEYAMFVPAVSLEKGDQARFLGFIEDHYSKEPSKAT